MKNLRLTALVLAFAAALAASARAQVVTPDPAPTIITSAPYTISQPGYYQLGANLIVTSTSGNIITINASNVTLDFAGHYISGPSNTPASQLYGVYANEEGNLIIRNGTVAFCSAGISLNGNGKSGSLNINQRVENMLVSYCYVEGINFYFANNSTVEGCTVSYTGGSTQSMVAIGIYFNSGSGNTVDSTTVTNVNSSGGLACAFYSTSGGGYATNNKANNVTVSGSSTTNCAGLTGFTFARGNSVYNSYYGLQACVKYEDTLTSGCTTSFSGGTAVGSNN